MFYTSVPKLMITCYTVPDIWCMLDVIVFHLGYFLPFYPPNSPKNKNLKKHLEISSFYTSVPKIMIICYTILKIWCVKDVIVVFHSGHFFTLLPPQQPKKWKFQKSETTGWRYHHFTQEYQKSWLHAILFLRYGTWRM